MNDDSSAVPADGPNRISKRLRYEVLNRDDHTCRYCGGRAPEVQLTVDHVVPAALGGSNDPSNLVAACKGCNAGKSSSNPEAPRVAEVAADAIRWAEAIREAGRRWRSDATVGHAEFYDAWMASGAYWLPPDWPDSVSAFIKAGLEVEDMPHVVAAAMRPPNVSNRWKYACGVAWGMVRNRQEAARALVGGDDPASTEDNHIGGADSDMASVVGAGCARLGVSRGAARSLMVDLAVNFGSRHLTDIELDSLGDGAADDHDEEVQWDREEGYNPEGEGEFAWNDPDLHAVAAAIGFGGGTT